MFRQDTKEMIGFSLGAEETYDAVGCAVSSVFHIAEQALNQLYTPRLVKIIVKQMEINAAIDDRFFVSWKKCFAVLGLKVSVKFADADYICKPGEYEVLVLKKPGHTHFVPGDGKGNYSWDPLGYRDAQKDYILTGKRIITILGEI